jgi:hypothetical protein
MLRPNDRHNRPWPHLRPTGLAPVFPLNPNVLVDTVAPSCGGVFSWLVDLRAAIRRFLTETNDNREPFVWTADPDNFIGVVRRGY